MRVPLPFPIQAQRCRGTVSVVALIICAIGTLGLLGMVTIMQSRVAMVESIEDECLRHVREWNGRQLAKEFAFQRVFTSASGAASTVEIPGGWGRITVPAWSRSAFSTTVRATVFNHIGPDSDGLPFQLSYDVSVFDRLDFNTGEWITTSPRTLSTRIQSRPLANTGVLLDARRQTPGRTIDGDLTVWGTALIWQDEASDDTFSFKAEDLRGYNDSVSKPNVDVDLAGTNSTLPPRNLPGLTMPTWFAPAGSALSPGAYPTVFADDWAPFSSNAIAPSLTERAIALGAVTMLANSSYNRYGARCDGAGNMTVDLNVLNLPSVVMDGPLSLTVTGQGSAAAMISVENLSPIYLIIKDPVATNLRFTGSNARPLIVACTAAVASTLTLTFDSGADYRVYLLLDGQPGGLSSAGAVTLRGGISTDRNLTVDAGSFQIRPEIAHPEWFDQLLWRSFWVETYQSQL